MEDNEFEEVTIISHTDRPQRVFSEKSIEKLKDQVSLEIVKEINGTEDKTYSDDPRLAPGLRELEKLKQDHFGEGEGKIRRKHQIHFISRVAGESGQYLLGNDKIALLSNGGLQVPTPEGWSVYFVLPWGNRTLIFRDRSYPEVYDNELQLDRTLEIVSYTLGSRHVYSTPTHVYYRNINFRLTKIDLDLISTTIPQDGDIIDFFVCPKTETITTLNKTSRYISTIQSNSQTFQFQRAWMKSYFFILKKMYSDHFLVGETNGDGSKQHKVHLGDLQTVRMLTSVQFTTNEPSGVQNIRLLAPRQGINCFLVATAVTLELFCEYRLKLYHLKTLELPDFCGCLSNHRYGLWMLGLAGSTILSVRVDFSKCPALQL